MSDATDPDFTETTLASELVYDGRWLKLRKDRVALPDGNSAEREWIQHPGAVMIIPLLDDDTVIMERQYRYPLRRHFYELPAGKIEVGEQPLATAKRELIEECGYQAASWQHLITLHPCIGYSDERIELFIARDLTQIGRQLDEGEFLEVLPMPVTQVLEWIRLGKITDTKAIIGMLWLQHFVTAGRTKSGG